MQPVTGFHEISIHALREEGDALLRQVRREQAISIHALREEGDGLIVELLADHVQISIHALREEGDTFWRSFSALSRYFYPRPPRGGRPSRCLAYRPYIPISIHALREEGDASG